MKLEGIFRLLVEGYGMKYLLSNQSMYFIKDLQPSISCDMIYLWQSMLRDKIVQQFINSEGSDGCIHQISYKYSSQTGFDYGNIHSLLTSLSLGIQQAFWGIEPADDTHSLSVRFKRNKSAWKKRQSIFNDGFLRILSNGKYGFIASDGTVIIEPQYKSAGIFNDGLACVRDIDDNTYFINILGNKEIEFKLEKSSSSDTFSICEMNHGISTYEIFNRCQEGQFVIKKGMINSQGRITPPIYEYIYNDSDCNTVVVKKNGNYSLVRKEDFVDITSCEFSWISPFKRRSQKFTLAILKNGQHVLLTQDGKIYHYLNELDEDDIRPYLFNNIVLRFRYGNLLVFDENFKRIYYTKGYIVDDRFFNTTSSIIEDLSHAPLLYLKCGAGSYANGIEYIFIKPNGYPLNNDSYSMAFQFINGIAWVKKGNIWYRINTKGEIIFSILCFDILSPEYNNSLLARDKRDGLLKLISAKGETLFIFTKSQNSEVKIEFKSKHIYSICTPEKKYLWCKGVLTEFEGELINGLSKFYYNLSQVEGSIYRFYDLICGKSYVCNLKDENDHIEVLISRYLARGVLCFRTTNSKIYYINVYKNNTSVIF